MKPKILQVRGIAFEKKYSSINDELKNDFYKELKVVDELNFIDAYKTNRRGNHYDIFLGKTGTIIFRPFHFVDGLDDFCYFNIQQFSEDKKHAIEFYQWSSKRHSKMELWYDNEHLITASQKKSIRSSGNKNLIKKNDVYETINFFLRYIVGKSIEDLSDKDKIYRCIVEKKATDNTKYT